MMQPQPLSSGSDEDPKYAKMDDRKRKRMISNRESARRSRMKKQQRLDELIGQAASLQAENAQIAMEISKASQAHAVVESQNNVLRAQMMELTDRLRSLNSLLQVVEDVSGFAVDIQQIPEMMLEPWQLPCPVPPIMAASDVFQF